MDQYHESQTAGKCIATSSPAKHDMSQARLYRINDYDVEQNYEKSCLASVPQQYLIHKQHKHLDISDQPKSNAILGNQYISWGLNFRGYHQQRIYIPNE